GPRRRRGAQPVVSRAAPARRHRLPPPVRRPGVAPRRPHGAAPGPGRAGRGAPGLMDPYLVGVLSNIGMFSFVALSAYLVLLVGEISFGQQAFFAIGAYAAGIATAMWGLPLGPGLALGAIAGGLAGALVGLPTLRLRGLYF